MNAISANDLGLPAIVLAWQSAWENWIEAGDKPGAGDFDTPECLHWADVKYRLSDHIKGHPIRSDRDAKALVRFAWFDSGAAHIPDDWTPDVQRWCLEKLMEWASTPDRASR